LGLLEATTLWANHQEVHGGTDGPHKQQSHDKASTAILLFSTGG
jgi:hypothetical protein